MQLRNGKQLSVTASASVPVITGAETKEQFTAKMKVLINKCQPSDYGTKLDRLNNMLPIFTGINKMSVEMLTDFDPKLRFQTTLYEKSLELTVTIIERSYLFDKVSYEEKIASIRLLSEMYKARKTIADILWKGRTNKNIQEMMYAGDRHSEQLYRCLKHMTSDLSESTHYEIYTYDDGEYSDVELYNWFLLPNIDENLPDDEYINNADHCFGGKIDRFNVRMWN
jgi:hypothetical protein